MLYRLIIDILILMILNLTEIKFEYEYNIV
jgi:hypothetical protein